MTIKTNTHERQAMWCDGCQRASINPREKYTSMGGKNFCQDCEPIVENAGALR